MTKANFDKLKRAYRKADKARKLSFVLDGVTYQVGYAKYLVEFNSKEFSTMK